ncbi:MAG: stilbene synthase [Deltaproteobacteria bacterium]|nr:stilbene synthase [Deltaproteobacteria bacterium]
MSAPIHIGGVGTAVTDNPLPQAEAAAFASRFFGDIPPRVRATFDNAGIEQRQLARPISWYESPRSFPEKNAVYQEVVLSLSERAAQAALAKAQLAPGAIAAVVFVSSTGVATPSLDARLSQQLDLPAHVMRVPLWGLGCAGGGAGLARAAALVRGLDAPVLLVCAEACSVTFVHGDHRKAAVVATALFGDGAAAAVLLPGEGPGPRVLDGLSHLIPHSEAVMGWDLCDEGLAVRFSPEIPAITHQLAPVIVQQAMERQGLSAPPARLTLHPGGPKVIAAYEQALALPSGTLADERAVLRDHGNMSSPTVLFVLERALANPPASGDYGLVLGLGPGFCAEGVVVRW